MLLNVPYMLLNASLNVAECSLKKVELGCGSGALAHVLLDPKASPPFNNIKRYGFLLQRFKAVLFFPSIL
jgi:hypothetical protein